MRTLRKNKQRLYYALYKGSEPTYVLDENGDKIINYIDEDGNIYYEETGEDRNVYDNPVEFFGNIAMSGGESEAVEYGLDLSSYEAILITERDSLPIDEQSVIWFESKPKMNQYGTTDEFSADYRVIAIKPSLNFTKYVLSKITK